MNSGDQQGAEAQGIRGLYLSLLQSQSHSTCRLRQTHFEVRMRLAYAKATSCHRRVPQAVDEACRNHRSSRPPWCCRKCEERRTGTKEPRETSAAKNRHATSRPTLSL